MWSYTAILSYHQGTRIVVVAEARQCFVRNKWTLFLVKLEFEPPEKTHTIVAYQCYKWAVSIRSQDHQPVFYFPVAVLKEKKRAEI